MDIFEAYEMSHDALREGVWAELVLKGERIGAIRVKPSDAELNPEYRKALASVATAVIAIKKEKGIEAVANETDALMIATAANTILTDWELYETKDGKEMPIKFSPKKAIELMTKLPKLFKAVDQAAKQWTKFRQKEADEAVKT